MAQYQHGGSAVGLSHGYFQTNKKICMQWKTGLFKSFILFDIRANRVALDD